MAKTKTLYRVVTIIKPPFVYYDPVNDTYTGMLIDLLRSISRQLRFDYEIYHEPGMDYGYTDDNGNWHGLIAEVKEGRAHIGLGAVSFMAERRKVVDFTYPIYPATGISVLMQRPAPKSEFFRFVTVLDRDVWMCILGAYVVTSLLLWIFDTYSPYSYQNNREKFKDDSEKRIFTLKESLWFCLTSLTPQGGGEAPKNLSGRLVAATWWLFGFIILASYTANLAAFLTITKFEKNIETFDDLINQYKYSYSVIENSSTYKYFQRMNDIELMCYEKWKDMTLNDSLTPYERAQLAVWEYPLSDKYIKIFAAINFHRTLKNLAEGLQKLNDPDSKFALITDANDVKYHVMTNCSYQEIGPEFSKKPYAIVLKKNSPLTEQFNEVIARLNDKNWIKSNQEKWWKKSRSKKSCPSYDDINNGLNEDNIGGVFVLICGGIIVAMITLVCEYFYYRHLRSKIQRIFNVNWERLKLVIERKTKTGGIV